MNNVQNIKKLLEDAAKNRYAVGSFSARYTKLIRPILEAAIQTNSPVIVQLSEKEIIRHQVGVKEFADEFYRVVRELNPKVPLALHLDHTESPGVIEKAIDAGFTSVMIDASRLPLEENVQLTKTIVKIAHPANISVEAELGKIGTTDFVETDTDEELYTEPEEAALFCKETGIDCLAVSVGTAHGVYTVRQPKIDYERLKAINKLTETPLVLHGGSGIPSEMVVRAVRMAEGGVSKVNIATDLELEMLSAVGREGHMTEAGLNSLSDDLILKAQEKVRKLVEIKITDYLLSNGRASVFGWSKTGMLLP